MQNFFKKEKVSDILPYESLSSESAVTEIQSGNGRISISGVQTKLSLVADNGILRFVRDGEQGRYILKPIPNAMHLLERNFLPINEYLCMQIASNAYGIETAECGLCHWQDGNPAYITKRFDVNPDGTKRSMEDFASLAGLTTANGGSDFKYCNLSYEDCAGIIMKHVAASAVEVLKYFRLVVYNFLICNDDAHLKNFSLIEHAPGDYVLSPAYDLVNTSFHLYQPRIFALNKGLFKEGMVMTDIHTVDKQDFEEFGRRIGLSEKIVNRELSRFSIPNRKVEEMVCDIITEESLRKSFLLSFRHRQNMISH
ncbi:MAG: HipA domain-containing protein [Bacteroidales bacterium]|nr:HipA domain-containing protein [Bacteroidales bacterium]